MTPFLSDTMFRFDPAYRHGFKDGFEMAQSMAEKRLKTLLKEIRNLEAYATSTATTSGVGTT